MKLRLIDIESYFPSWSSSCTYFHHSPRQKRSKATDSMGRDCVHWDWNLLRRIAGLLAGTDSDYGSHDAGRIGLVSDRGFLFCVIFSTQEVKLTQHSLMGGDDWLQCDHRKNCDAGMTRTLPTLPKVTLLTVWRR
jgi:hypothetical protein